jgi:stage III sporulation protein AC
VEWRLNVEIIWQIAGVAILTIVVHAVVKSAGRDDLAWLITFTGVALVLFIVMRVVNDLFQTVRAMFQI